MGIPPKDDLVDFLEFDADKYTQLELADYLAKT